MLIEIHILENYAPSNLNRDENNNPKTAIFGGVQRARISSQCLKRNIRVSPEFKQILAGIPLGIASRTLPELVRAELNRRKVSPQLAEIAAQKVAAFGTTSQSPSKEEDPENSETESNEETEDITQKHITKQRIFFTDQEVVLNADVFCDAINHPENYITPKTAKKNAKEKIDPNLEATDLKLLQTKIKSVKKLKPYLTPDIALLGRMTTSDAFPDVKAALQVAHAISTNPIELEFDYFSAIDDLDTKGFAMAGHIPYNSACFYKYFSIDTDQLRVNLNPHFKTNLKEILKLSIKACLKAIIYTNPSGKQNAFAAFSLPDAILIEIRPKKGSLSYANAFSNPIEASGKLIENSIATLIKHADELTKCFSLETIHRLWFTTSVGQGLPPPSNASKYENVNDLLEVILSYF